MEKLARYVEKEEKIWVKLIVNVHVLEQISHVASTGAKGSRKAASSGNGSGEAFGTRFLFMPPFYHRN
jgi:hypothetical protein